MARDRTYTPKVNSKKHILTSEEADIIRSSAKEAQSLLDNAYLQTYLKNTRDSILHIHAAQLENDYEETTEHNGTKKTVKSLSVKQYTLLAGEYRFVDKFISSLQQDVEAAKLLNEKITTGEVELSA